AQTPLAAPPPPDVPPPVEAAPAPNQMPAEVPAAPAAEATPPSALEGAPLAGTLAMAPPSRGPNVSYGIGARLRWVSVPKWMLNLFTKKNVPLSSYSTALEFFRRKGEFDFIVSVGYMGLSPPDGNWLGRGHDATVDTDYVQFKGLGMVGIDASFVWHSFLTDWFGLHYGAGLGLGIITGKMLRTSNSDALCTEANAGDYVQCHPKGVTCGPSGCSDSQLAATEGGVDDPTDPHRFRESNVPPALPIVNVIVGMDFRLPHVRGWEAKIEGGFYDAFFLGGGVGYTF
ncbi:MAG: hypothetical protein JWM82_3294, partial [Myxococcales bacterium]|nr:hypothetical protein [Myxococcales bacterium]